MINGKDFYKAMDELIMVRVDMALDVNEDRHLTRLTKAKEKMERCIQKANTTTVKKNNSFQHKLNALATKLSLKQNKKRKR